MSVAAQENPSSEIHRTTNGDAPGSIVDNLNASRAVEGLEERYRRSQAVVFYSHKLALMGSVATTVAKLVSDEEGERKALQTEFQVACSITVPFDPIRVSQNKIMQDESESRSGVISEEFAAHMAIYNHFLSASKVAFASLLNTFKNQRMVLEREAVSGVLRCLVEYETNMSQILSVHYKMRQHAEEVSSKRRGIENEESFIRELYGDSESIEYRGISRRKRMEHMTLVPVQQAYELDVEKKRKEYIREERRKREREAVHDREEQCSLQRDRISTLEAVARIELDQEQGTVYTDLVRMCVFQIEQGIVV